MFRKLRIRLTVLCSAVTALVLAVLTVLCISISESGVRQQEDSAFQTNLNTMYQNLQQQTVLSHNWIRQTEFRNQFFLRILDNGVPLFFQNQSEDAGTNALLDLAAEIAADEYGIRLTSQKAPKSHIFHKEFKVTEDMDALGKDVSRTFSFSEKQEFFVSVALIPYYNGTLGVLVLHPLSQMQRRMAVFRRSFLAADLAALAALTVFFWFFLARMLKPLQENQQKQVHFVAAASHELRSPLAVIRSQVDAAKNGSMAADQQFLDTLSEEGQRMSRLISDMLQLATADEHNWDIRLSAAELDTLLLQTWEAYEPLSRAKGLQWDIRLPEESPVCRRCDSERIRQLLSILIDNAFSYTPSGGRVCIALETVGQSVRIIVSDNGPGIPDDQKTAVFERFYCADPSHKNKAHFGLGLCIAQEIVKLHKGRLILSDTPGGGATFTVIL